MPMYGAQPPMMPGKKKKRMPMADGDLSAPSEIDSPPSSGAAPPDQSEGMMPKIAPEAVNYHDEAQSCQMCQYYGGGQCEVLQMPVQAEGGCTAFDDGSGGGDMSASPEGMNPEMMPS